MNSPIHILLAAVGGGGKVKVVGIENLGETDRLGIVSNVS